jgi:hypothetical protein
MRRQAQPKNERKDTKAETTISKGCFHRECSMVVLAAAAMLARSVAAEFPFQNAFLLNAAGKI